MPSEMFVKGLTIREEVVGADVVRATLRDADDFSHPMQELLTEFCWGTVWARPGLDRRSRSILNIGMLAAANRPEELAGHIKTGLRNGLTPGEIQELLLQVAVYLGMPAGLGAFRVARGCFEELND